MSKKPGLSSESDAIESNRTSSPRQPARRPAFSRERLAEAVQRITHKQDPDRWRQFDCRLVTPMYGGGVVARRVDTDMPIRAASIRGQLRFWWRVTQPKDLSPAELFERESAIWGGIGRKLPRASKVGVRVRCEPVQRHQLEPPRSGEALKYAFGPAVIKAEGVSAERWLAPGYSFSLLLRYESSVAEEVEKALRWWMSFGGIGARTRRGFGAILIHAGNAFSPVTQDDVEALGGRLRFGGVPVSDAVRAWQDAVEKLRKFRQAPGFGRRRGENSPFGRSYWPEPDQIRRFSDRNAKKKHIPKHLGGNVFPRAAFGLPITFEYHGSPGEPDKHELYPAGDRDRRASPLILRPYRVGERWRSAALLLPGWEGALEQKLRFKDHRYPEAPMPWAELADPAAAARTIDPMKHSDGTLRGTDPLTAFMHFFAEVP